MTPSFRVALIGPEFEENLGLRYLHAALAQAGYQAKIFDFRKRADIPEVARRVLDWKADVAGLSMTFARRSREFVDLAKQLRGEGFAGHLTCGGHFATLHAEQLLRDVPELDTVVSGEAEESLVELLQNLPALEKVPGIWRRLSDGAPALTAPRPVTDSLDGKPWPTREEVPDAILGLPMADLLAGRGCWGRCHYCSIGAWHQAIGGKRFRQRGVEDLAAEMAALYRRGIRIFNFTDDNFFLPDREANLARFEALRQRLLGLGVGRIALQIKARPESLDGSILEALQKLGVFRIFLGVESDSERSLQALGRKSTREQNREALRLVVAGGFHVSYNLLAFEPDTTLEEVRAHLAFIREFPAVPLGLCRTEVYGGTPLAQRLKEQGRLEGDYLGFDYRMTDPAAERVYRAWYRALGKRSFDLGEGMGPRSMALDHQLHLLGKFWPERVTESLRDRVAGFICDLNAHTTNVLEEMCEAAARSPSEAEWAEHVARWEKDCADFDARLDRISKRLFVEMAAMIRVPRRSTDSAFVYGLMCFLIFLAAMAIVTVFGQNIRALFAASTELAGEEAPPPPPSPGTFSSKRKPVRNFGQASGGE